MFDLNYKHIVEDTKNEEDKKYFAEKVIYLIEERLVKEHGVQLEDWHKKDLEVLKALV